MNDGLLKKEIRFLVTAITQFNFKHDLYALIRTFRYSVGDDHYYEYIIINYCKTSAILHDQNHIYIYRENDTYYIDIDFNLMPNKEQLSKCIFDQLSQYAKKAKIKYPNWFFPGGNFFTNKLELIGRNHTEHTRAVWDLTDLTDNKDVDYTCPRSFKIWKNKQI